MVSNDVDGKNSFKSRCCGLFNHQNIFPGTLGWRQRDCVQFSEHGLKITILVGTDFFCWVSLFPRNSIFSHFSQFLLILQSVLECSECWHRTSRKVVRVINIADTGKGLIGKKGETVSLRRQALGFPDKYLSPTEALWSLTLVKFESSERFSFTNSEVESMWIWLQCSISGDYGLVIWLTGMI